MPLPEPFFAFPGVQQIVSAEFTLSHGIAPSVGRLEIAPQANLIAREGTLLIQMGQVQIQFDGCRIVNPTINRDTRGLIMSFNIEDRRWRWRNGEIYGHYNLKRPDGSIDTLRSKEANPQELASFCLQAMGEQADVSALPTSAVYRPEKIWNGANPAQELDTICEALGCRVMLSIQGNVRIVRAGYGADLPSLPSRMRVGYGATLSGQPDSLKFICAPTIYQSKLKLEAVGLDRDGRIKKIADLSYAPSGGDWSQESPMGFFGISNKADRRLALRTVWRWFRVQGQADGSGVFTPPGYQGDQVSFLHQILPLHGKLLQKNLDDQRDAQDEVTDDFLPAFVEGIFVRRDFSWGNTDLYSDVQQSATVDGDGNVCRGTRYIGSWSLDDARGLVMFSDWVVKLDTDNQSYVAPELYLTCSYSVRNNQTKVMDCFKINRELPVQPSGTGPRIIQARDVYRTVIASYGQDGITAQSTTTNESEYLRPLVNELLDAVAAEYQTPETEDGEYAGFEPIDVDGRIQQVGWSLDVGGGARTRASVNTEYDLVFPDFKKRRDEAKSRAIQGLQYVQPRITGAK